MHIVGYFHLAVPEHNAGSETTVWADLRAMVRRGHQVTIICDRSMTAPYTHDGIHVVRPPRRGQQHWLQTFVKDCDLLVTHLDLTSQAMGLATDANKPLAHFVHNSAQLNYWHVKARAFGKGPDWAPSCRLVVFNSAWIAELERWEGDQITIHPVVEPQYYRCERGDKITLVNPTPGKGAATFKALAKQMLDREFLAVEGGYGEQIVKASYENVEWMAHTPNITKVFRQTRVLLMPSDYESYGRVGIEAACAGIPTICHPTPGLTEAFGDAGIFIDRNDIAAWHNEIERLFNDDLYYRKRSDQVLKLAASLDPESEFDRLEQAFINTVSKWKNKETRRMEKIVLSNCRLGKTAGGKLTNNMSEAQSLVCGNAGDPVPTDLADQAKQLGFAQVSAIQTESLLNTDQLVSQKAVAGPSENKAVEPEDNKAEPKKRGRRKAA